MADTHFSLKGHKNVVNIFYPHNGILHIVYKNKGRIGALGKSLSTLLKVMNNSDIEKFMEEKSSIRPRMDIKAIHFDEGLDEIETCLENHNISFTKGNSSFSKYRFILNEPIILGKKDFIEPKLSEKVMDILGRYFKSKEDGWVNHGFFDDRPYTNTSNGMPSGRYHIFDNEYKSNYKIPGFIAYINDGLDHDTKDFFAKDSNYYSIDQIDCLSEALSKMRSLSKELEENGMDVYFSDKFTISAYIKTGTKYIKEESRKKRIDLSNPFYKDAKSNALPNKEGFYKYIDYQQYLDLFPNDRAWLKKELNALAKLGFETKDYGDNISSVKQYVYTSHIEQKFHSIHINYEGDKISPGIKAKPNWSIIEAFAFKNFYVLSIDDRYHYYSGKYHYYICYTFEGLIDCLKQQ